MYDHSMVTICIIILTIIHVLDTGTVDGRLPLGLTGLHVRN